MNLSDRVALVTGGASGIGRGIAGVLLSRGARVAITDVRPEALEETRAYFSGYRERVLTYPLDVSDRPAFGGVVSYIERDLGLIEVLINNAGVGYSGVPLHQTPDNDIDWVLDVNLKGVLNGIKAVVPGMVERRSGWVVNVSSMSGLALPSGIHHGLYGATKAAVTFLSEGMRQDLIGSGVGVTVLCPGYVRTNLPWSSTYRSAKHGGPTTREPSPGVLAAMRRAMDPAEAGELVAGAIEQEKFFVFTDIEEMTDVLAWHSRVDEALAAVGA